MCPTGEERPCQTPSQLVLLGGTRLQVSLSLPFCEQQPNHEAPRVIAVQSRPLEQLGDVVMDRRSGQVQRVHHLFVGVALAQQFFHTLGQLFIGARSPLQNVAPTLACNVPCCPVESSVILTDWLVMAKPATLEASGRVTDQFTAGLSLIAGTVTVMV